MAAAEALSSTAEEFIKKAKEVHGDIYDYSKVRYIRSAIKVEIICPTHGSFHQTPNAHLTGSACARCNNWISQEKLIAMFEKVTNREFERGYRHEYLARQHFDGYNKELNLAIEYDGEGHYIPIKWSSKWTDKQTEDNLKKTKERDRNKNKICEDMGIALIRWKYDKDINEKNVIKALREHNVYG